ncbi:MAG: S8 family serine peptidase, partial [Rhodospirillaceae bacterium]|nr:S8 family serine peptidase [Rhodospirillaceae bacterium]
MKREDLRGASAPWGELLNYSAFFVDAVPFGPIAAFIPDDPDFEFQWHLNNTGQTGGTAGIDINVTEVWNDYTGTGVVIGIIDDGVQHDHPDLAANYDTALDHDARDRDSDAAPGTADDNHGTTVAGTIAADGDNGVGLTGVAYDATIAGFRMGYGSAGTTGQVVESLALQVNVDISNNSWGYGGYFVDDFSSSEFRPAGDAILNAVTAGRDGLGTVYVFAAGNERGFGGDVNYHNFQNSPHTIAVAALDHNGQVASFSTPGAAVLVSAPGVDIATTDRTGGDGYVDGDYVYISGTSFSSPITSGVAALMLEANPGLGYRDVQEILAYSARQTDSSSPGWDVNGAANWNGGGLHTSHDYGFGLVDAHAAVRLAESWGLTSTQANLATLSASSAPALVISDHTTITDTITLTSGLNIDHIEVDLDLSHTWIGDLVVSLTSPDDTTSILVNQPGFGGAGQDNIDFTLSSTHSWGETGAGTWTLSVTDLGTLDQGSLNSWTLRLLGDAINTDDTYIYTDEFGAFSGVDDASRRILSDADGNDTLNAAAVTSNSVINLNPGANGTLAGNSLTIAAGTFIENAYAGDGNDLLTGNLLGNSLYGGRGDDVLSGGAGNDFLDAGVGTNTFLVGAGEASDTILVGNESLSTDTLRFDNGIGLGDVGFAQGGNDLIIQLSATHGGGAVTVSGFFAEGGGQRIDEIEFDGGTTTLSVANFTQLSDFPNVNAPTVDDQGFSIDENVSAGTVVGTVVASDADADDILSFAITAGNVGSAFTIDAGSGEITVQGALDFEALADYALTVSVSDSLLLSDTATVSIGLNDLNEAPTLGDRGFTLDENSSVHTVVGTIVASDPDANEILRYAITAGNEGGAFTIDAVSGIVTVTGGLDFESLANYALTVRVNDSGLLSDTATVSIGLNDLNEAPTADDQDFSVDENVSAGTVVGTVVASDQDAGEVLSYAITEGNTGGAFAIDAGSGEITVQGTLNFESAANYILTVSVTDSDLLSDTVAVNIGLTDINEAPIVGDWNFTAVENSAAGTVVGTVVASEPDAGDTLSYAITAGDEDGAFTIDAGTGEITVQGLLDFESVNAYTLTVSATDLGGLSSDGTVSVRLSNVSSFAADDLNGSNGFELLGIAADAYSGISVSGVGDIDGDGFDDILIGAPNRGFSSDLSGKAFVVFGSASGMPSTIELRDLLSENGGDGSDGFVLFGAEDADQFGRSVSSAGDVNGDGFDDLIVGAPSYVSLSNEAAGDAYVVFGSGAGFAAELNMVNLLSAGGGDGSDGFVIHGIDSQDHAGLHVSGGGDINGDGYSDLVVTAFRGDPGGTNNAGETFVILGSAGGFAAELDLSSLLSANGGDGSAGFVVEGINANDTSGGSAALAGDINGDGYDDLVIGAASADPNGSGSGESYVLFGRPGGFTAHFALSDLLAANGGNGSAGFVVNGIAQTDFSGWAVDTAGDINGDGIDDLLIAAKGSDVNGIESGQAFVLFGRSGAFTAEFELSDLLSANGGDGSLGFAMNGAASRDGAGQSVAFMGDLNGDGFDDLAVSSHANIEGESNYPGRIAVVFGKADGFDAELEFGSLSDIEGGEVVSDGFLIPGTLDRLGVDIAAAGDFNGDGLADLIAGATNENTNGSRAGAAYTFFGQNFSGDIDFLGGAGNDTLSGTGADEILIGGAGNDTLSGGYGNDQLSGAHGDDRFIFADGDGADLISDFQAGAGSGDIIGLSGHSGAGSFA